MKIYSVIETAKANGLEPYWYFRYLLEKMKNGSFEKELAAIKEG